MWHPCAYVRARNAMRTPIFDVISQVENITFTNVNNQILPCHDVKQRIIEKYKQCSMGIG